MPLADCKGKILFPVYSFIELCVKYMKPFSLSLYPTNAVFHFLSCQCTMRNPLIDMTEKAVVQQKWYGLLQ